ncbi:iron-containing alcohol dehydrogenase [Streptomyces chrestomyceticus]|uniref:iron-containing alcohol dehydrogenase n=1 Tax=Streptomyces chrestomyceticus TaxID=68185 RepID=UPI0033CB0D36
MVVTASPAWSWHSPTQVLAGHGATEALGTKVRQLGRTALFVTDPALETADEVRQHLARAQIRTHLAVVDEPHPSLAAVNLLCRTARSARVDVVTGFGGGRCLDVAKAVAAGLRNPGLLDPAGDNWNNSHGLVAPGHHGLRPCLPSVLIPTTLGTSSEVNAVVSLTHQSRKKLMLHGLLRARLAILDPVHTRTLPPQLVLSGTLEAMLRLAVPMMTSPHPAPLEDDLALALLGRLLNEGESLASGDTTDTIRLRIAKASAATQTNWALTGRDPRGHRLWYLTNDLAALAGVSKMSAMAAALPHYLSRVVSGDLRYGHASRLAELGHRLFHTTDAATAADSLASLVSRWSLPHDLPPALDPHAIAASTWCSWGQGRPYLPDFTEADLEEFYATVLAAFGQSTVCADRSGNICCCSEQPL